MTGTSGYKIDHLGIAVRSLAVALEFWQAKLGMKLLSTDVIVHEKVKVAMLEAGESRIELLEPTSKESVVARFLDREGEGLHHVAMCVPDLLAAIERLEAAGARLVNRPQVGAGGHWYVFVHPESAGGVLLELIQDQERST